MNQGAYARVQNRILDEQRNSLPFVDESYFSIFYSPRQIQRSADVKYACNILFVVLLSVRLMMGKVPWVTIFMPTFISNIVSVHTFRTEWIQLQTTVGSSYAAFCRPIAYLLDVIASLFAKVVIISFLSVYNQHSTNNWTLALTPVWILVLISTLLRCIPYFPTSVSAAYKKKHIIGMGFSTLAFFLFRFLQPFLFALRVDSIIRNPWSIVFAPSWVLTFFGLACSMLMVSLAPFINNFTNQDYRIASRRLLYVLAFHIVSLSLASIFFIVLLTQKLDNHIITASTSDGSTTHFLEALKHDTFRVFAPLIVVFVVFILSHPTLLHRTLKFQVNHIHQIVQLLFDPIFHFDVFVFFLYVSNL